MFSARSKFDLEVNALAALLERRRKGGLEILNLTQSNPTAAGLDYPPGILDAFRKRDNLIYQPLPAGHRDARQALSSLYSTRGCRAAPEDLFLTASTSEAYSFLFKLVADPGEAVLVPQPSYPLFHYLAGLESVRPVAYRLHSIPEWIVDLDEIRHLIRREKPRALLFVHPNNPTGSFLSEESWTSFQEISLEHDLPLICDEVFFDYPLAQVSPLDIAAEQEVVPLFILNGLSKMLLLPQLKLAWILLRGPAGFKKEARARLELIGDTYLSVNAVAQNALPELLGLRGDQVPEVRARLAFNLESLREVLPPTPIRLIQPEGGWYAVLRVPPFHSDMQWALRFLDRAGVYSHPGVFFGFDREEYIVVSLLTESTLFRKGVERILEIVVQELTRLSSRRW